MPQGRREIDFREAAGVLAESFDSTVTMGEVAARLRLAKPTLYRLAGSKAELLRACIDAEGERLIGHLDAELFDQDTSDERLPSAAVLRAVERYAAESPGGFALLIERRGTAARHALDRVEAHLGELVCQRANRAGPQPRAPELQAAALLGAASAVVSRGLAGGRRLDADAVAAELQAAFGSSR